MRNNPKVKYSIIILLLIGLIATFFILLGHRKKAGYGKFIKISDMNAARTGHKMFPLSNGSILVYGGNPEYPAEIYDPKTQKFYLKEGAKKIEKHVYDNYILLNDDRLLITGGVISFGSKTGPATYSEFSQIYDPIKDRVIKTPDMNIARSNHTSIKLKNGKILIFGGSEQKVPIEIFDPKTNKFTILKNLPNYIYNKVAKTVPLADGRTLIINNKKEVEIFEPVLNTFTKIKIKNLGSPFQIINLSLNRFLTIEKVKKDRKFHTKFTIYSIKQDNKIEETQSVLNKEWKLGSGCFAQLDDENVLISGGIRGGEGFLIWDVANAYMYNLKNNKLIKINNMNIRRSEHSCIKIDKNKVLISGGYTQKSPIDGGHDYKSTNKAEIFIRKGE